MGTSATPPRTYTVRLDKEKESWIVEGERGETYAIYEEMVTAIATARDMARDNPPARVIFEDLLGEHHELANFEPLPPELRR